jgi:hypothetical protein
MDLLWPFIFLSQLYYMLSTIRHQAFPIIEFAQQRDKGDGHTLGTLNGIILRYQLMMILKNRAYGDRIHDTVRCRRMDFNEFMYGFLSLLCVSLAFLLRSVGSASSGDSSSSMACSLLFGDRLAVFANAALATNLA